MPHRVLKKWMDFAFGNTEHETVQVGANTEVLESDAGATILRNNGGYPINIELYPSGRAYLAGNSTATTISTQNEWYPIEGAWNANNLNYLTHDGSGGLTYQGDVTTQTQFQVGGSYISASNTAEYELAVFTDGTVKNDTIINFSPARQDEVLSLPTVFGFTDSTTTNMTHDIRVRCTSGATNITIPSLSFTLKG